MTKKPQPNWHAVRFGDVVRNVNAVERKPLENGIERFVGLEHLDPESLHIKRWGLVADGTTFTRKFVRGQVLFGKRRAYQHKAAVAEFDGICSSDILVFESANDELLPELLPFIVQSDGFFERALGTSAGSLSPRTKWKDLATYEFALPPLDEQRRIAEILWAADEAVEKYRLVLEHSRSLKSATVESVVTGKLKQKEKLMGELVLDVQYGTSTRSGAKKNCSVPVLRIPNIFKGGLDLSDLSWAVLTAEEKDRYAVQEGDILLVRTNGNPAYVSRSVAIRDVPKDAVFASYLIRLRVDRSYLRSEYLNMLLNSDYLRRTLKHEIRSSAGNYNINTQGLKRQRIPLLPLDEQDKLLEKMSKLDDAISQCEQHIEKCQELKSQLLNSMLDAKGV